MQQDRKYPSSLESDRPDKPRRGKDESDPRRKRKNDDRNLVGQDTDGDGKAVKPGQQPGQSRGHGLPESGNK